MNNDDLINRAEDDALRAELKEQAKEDAMLLAAYREAGLSTQDAMSLIVTYRLTMKIANGRNGQC